MALEFPGEENNKEQYMEVPNPENEEKTDDSEENQEEEDNALEDENVEENTEETDETDETEDETEDSEENSKESDESDDDQESNDDEDSEEDNEGDPLIKENFDYLKEQGALFLPDDYEFDGTEEGFQQALKDSQENLQKAVQNQIFEQIPNEKGKALFDYFMNGGEDIDTFIESMKGTDVNNLDLEQEDNQKQVIRDFYKQKGFSDKKIDKLIERSEDSDELKEDAEEAAEELKTMKEKQQEEMKKEAQEKRAQQEKEAQQAQQELQKIVEQKEEIKGFPISKEQREQAIKDILEPSQDEEGNTTTSFNAKLDEALRDPESIVLLDYLLSNDFDTSSLKTRERTKQTKSLKERLKKQKSGEGKSKLGNRGKTKSKSKKDSPNIDELNLGE